MDSWALLLVHTLLKYDPFLWIWSTDNEEQFKEFLQNAKEYYRLPTAISQDQMHR